MTRRFTGWHMTFVMVAFFAVVLGVNLTMARYAVGTFGGTVVDNSYVASQRYNGWLAQARQQETLGWVPTITTDTARRVVITIATPAGQLSTAHFTANATHPLGRLPARDLTFVASAAGWRSVEALPPGRWSLHINVSHGQSKAAFDDEIGG